MSSTIFCMMREFKEILQNSILNYVHKGCKWQIHTKIRFAQKIYYEIQDFQSSENYDYGLLVYDIL